MDMFLEECKMKKPQDDGVWPKFQKATEARQSVIGSESLQGSLKRLSCGLKWNLRCDEDSRILEMPGAWRVCQRKGIRAQSGAGLRERLCVLQTIELEVTKSTGVQITLPSTLDTGYGWIGFGLSCALSQSFFVVFLYIRNAYYMSLYVGST